MTLLRSLSRLAPVFVLGLAAATSASSASIAGSNVRVGANNVINGPVSCGGGVLCVDILGSSQARAQGDFNALRVYTTANSGGPSNLASATADAYSSFDFQLFGPGTADIALQVELYYHFDVFNSSAQADILSCLGCGPSGRVAVNDFPGLFNDSCPENQGINYGVVDCAGGHSGLVNASIIIGASQQSGQISAVAFRLTAVSIGGITDGFNTAYVNRIVVPNGVTWQYPDLAGNPLNFQYASAPSSVPEPGTWALLGLGLMGIAAVRRRNKN